MNNKFNLIQLIGLMTLSTGLMFFVTTLPQIHNNTHLFYEEQGFLFVLSFPYLVIGVCMLFRKHWTRLAGTILYLLSILFVLFYAIFISSVPKREVLMFFSFILMTCTLLFCLVLLINNKKVIAEYDRKGVSTFDDRDILDTDL